MKDKRTLEQLKVIRDAKKLDTAVNLVNILTPYINVNHTIRFAGNYKFYWFLVTTLRRIQLKHAHLNAIYRRELWLRVLYRKPYTFSVIRCLSRATERVIPNTVLLVKHWSICVINRTIIARPDFFKVMNIKHTMSLWRYFMLYYRGYLVKVHAQSCALVYSLLKSNLRVGRVVKNSQTLKTMYVMNLRNL